MKPMIAVYLELVFKVFMAVIALIFWGVLIAVVAMAIPFLLSLFCVLALAGANTFAFSWEYVWVGTIYFLILIGIVME